MSWPRSLLGLAAIGGACLLGNGCGKECVPTLGPDECDHATVVDAGPVVGVCEGRAMGGAVGGSVVVPLVTESGTVEGSSMDLAFSDGRTAAGLMISGSVALSAPNCGPGRSCDGSLDAARLEVGSFAIGDRTVDSLLGLLVRTIPLRFEPESETRSRFESVCGTPEWTAHIALAGAAAPLVLALTEVPPNTFHGYIDWSTRRFAAEMTLGDDPVGPEAQAPVVLIGNFVNLWPHADAGPDQRVDCTSPAHTPVSLTAAASTDPDGPDDLTSFTWEWAVAGAPQTAAGAEVTVDLPVGSYEVSLRVRDAQGTIDADTAIVVVASGPAGCTP